jgi:cyclohexa-1,5-dienecarbonyl-CoA hydratase
MSAPVRAVEERGGAWLRLVLDRPKSNLLSREVVRALAAALAAAPQPGRKWVTIEGAGGEFSWGAMIPEHLPGPMQDVLPETHALLRQLLGLPLPTAALVEGRCLGGGFELALACDLVFASEDASMGMPEIGLAAFPPAGAALLPLRVGASRAAEAVITGAARPADAWRQAGLVAAVVPRGSLPKAAGEWFDAHLARRSAVALAAAAVASRLTLRAAAEPAIAAAERLYLDRLLPTHDASEGVRAFMDKRTPQWKDR